MNKLLYITPYIIQLYYVVLFETILVGDTFEVCSVSPIDITTESLLSGSVLSILGVSLLVSTNRLLRAFKANNLK